MANSEITFSLQKGTLVPSDSGVSVVSGDTVSFTANDGLSALLYFSPAAASVLSPTPTTPVQLAPSATSSFTFTSSEPGAYSLFTSTDAIFDPQFPTQVGPELVFEIIPTPIVEAMPVVGSRTKDGQ